MCARSSATCEPLDTGAWPPRPGRRRLRIPLDPATHSDSTRPPVPEHPAAIGAQRRASWFRWDPATRAAIGAQRRALRVVRPYLSERGRLDDQPVSSVFFSPNSFFVSLIETSAGVRCGPPVAGWCPPLGPLGSVRPRRSLGAGRALDDQPFSSEPFPPSPFVFLIDGPFSDSTCALWTSRSQIASASVGSASISCQLFVGTWLVTTVER